MNLPSDVSESSAEFEEKIGDMIDQRLLDLPFAGVLLQSEEIKLVRVLATRGQVGLRGRQGAVEVGDRLAPPLDVVPPRDLPNSLLDDGADTGRRS